MDEHKLSPAERMDALERRLNRFESETSAGLDVLQDRLRASDVVDYLLIGCVVLLTFVVYKSMKAA